MQATQRGLEGIRQRAAALPPASPPISEAARELESRFRAALGDDLDLPRITALIPEVLRADIAPDEKRGLLEDWDRVLQLDLTRAAAEPEVPSEVAELAARRDAARADRDWPTSDRIRAEIEALGWLTEDTAQGTKLRPKRPTAKA